MTQVFNDFLAPRISRLGTTHVVLAALELSRPRGSYLPARRLFHRVISCIHAGRERPLKRIDPLLMFTKHLLLGLLLCRRRLRRGLLLRLGIGLALCHSTFHGSGHRSGTSSLAGVSGDCANRGASCSASRRSADTATLCLWRVCSGCLLGRLLFFLTRSLGWRSLRVYPSALFGHAVTLAFVLQLLVGTLTVLRKREHADILSRGPGWTGLLAAGRRRLPLC